MRFNYSDSPKLVVNQRNNKYIERAYKKAGKIPVVEEIYNAYQKADIRVVKESITAKEIPKKNVILICLTKDSKDLLPLFLEHYRLLGISDFVFIDNNSSDDTVDYLAGQDDCSVFITKEKYLSGVPSIGWINKVLSYYGYGRWYLVVDTDELFVFKGMERGGIQTIVKYAEKNRIKRVKSIMLDVYSDKPILSIDKSVMSSPDTIKSVFNLIDGDSYRKIESGMAYSPNVSGGPRERVFGKYGSLPALQKYPLFYYEKMDLRMSNHYLFPFEKNNNSPMISGLLHYKFLPGDLEKYKIYIKTGTHYNDSSEYKAYVKKLTENPNTTMLYDGSVEYENSDSLSKLPIMEDLKLY